VDRKSRRRGRRKQDKWRLSLKQPKDKAYFFYFPLPFSTIGLLSALNKHKNDCHSMFYKDRLFFVLISMVFWFLIQISEGQRRKYRYEQAGRK
jgi:hypothetical protein